MTRVRLSPYRSMAYNQPGLGRAEAPTLEKGSAVFERKRSCRGGKRVNNEGNGFDEAQLDTVSLGVDD